jgi:hypothetical protein
MRIGMDPNGIFSMDQEYYLNNFLQGLRDQPGGGSGSSKQLILDMLSKGGRGIEGSTNGYSSYPQLYADLMARATSGDLPMSALDGLPTPEQVVANPTKYPGLDHGAGGIPRTEAAVAQAGSPAATPATPGSTPAAPNTPDPAVAAAAQAKKDQFAGLGNILNSLGLGSLFGMDPAGNPTGWLWDQIQLGLTTPEEMSVALERTPQWQSLYGVVINAQRKEVSDGKPVHVMSPAELAEYRQRARTLYRQYNYPPDFYNDVHDFDAQAAGGIDVQELQHRIADDWNRVANADPHIRQRFLEYYGPGQGDAYLAAFFADPGRTLADVDLAARSAVVGGTGARVGLGIQRSLAERIARTGVSDAGIDQQLTTLAQAAGFYRPNVGEGGGDLTAQAVGGGFGVAGSDTGTVYQDLVDVEARKRARLSTTELGHGGPVETRTGVVGVGPAR